jgi:hypothetical protein
MRRLITGAGATLLALVIATAGYAEDPRLTVSKLRLDRAITCEGKIGAKRPQPLIFSTGTGTTAEEGYSLIRPAVARLRRPVCLVEYPDFTTADIQISAQYLVNAIRVVSRRAHRPVAIYGISQGALLPRWALTYWPSLRRKVTDVVAAAGTQHGTIVTSLLPVLCGPYRGCPPAVWQQAATSEILRTLNSGRDETPGPTAWTTVRSATDEVVQPQTGPRPTSSLRGATNILIQDVCPGRAVSHVGTEADSVAFAALRDAITHSGAARVSRLPESVCGRPYAAGIDPATIELVLSLAQQYIAVRGPTLPAVLAEPPVRAYAGG